jgi:sugar (pentulose or hexulose) kinase
MTYYAADSTLGAAIIAAVGSGYDSRLEEAVAQMVHSADTTLPAPNQVAAYATAYEEYVQWREQLYPRRVVIPYLRY